MTDLLPLLEIPDETEIMRDTQVALSRATWPNGIWWRQNVGKAWMGKSQRLTKKMTLTLPAGTVVIRQPQMVKFGEAGQNDLMGIVHGRFVGVEIKSESGRQRTEQANWETAVRRAGGVSFVSRSPEHAVQVLRETIAEGGWDR